MGTMFLSFNQITMFPIILYNSKYFVFLHLLKVHYVHKSKHSRHKMGTGSCPEGAQFTDPGHDRTFQVISYKKIEHFILPLKKVV